MCTYELKYTPESACFSVPCKRDIKCTLTFVYSWRVNPNGEKHHTLLKQHGNPDHLVGKKSLKTTAALLHCEVGDDAKSIRSHPFIEPFM